MQSLVNVKASAIIPVILSGGAGTRLWPLSRQNFPKQMLPLIDDKSLLQNTISRLSDFGNKLSSPLLICNQMHRFLVAEQCRELDITPMDIILEPAGRNTAAAVACAALYADSLDLYDDPLLLILPADHHIENNSAFVSAVERSISVASQGLLMTFGIEPTVAHTGYGYLQQGVELGGHVFKVDEFIEKPEAAMAQAYLDKGGFLWNSGVFLFRKSAILQAFRRFSPDILTTVGNALTYRQQDLDFIRLDKAYFNSVINQPIDKAVMEKADNVAMVILDAGWSDLGSWESVFNALPKSNTADNNVTQGDVLLRSVQGSYVRSESRLVAAIGLTNHILVETADAVLVADKDKLGELKSLVSLLQLDGRQESMHNTKVYQPWGSYEKLVDGPGYVVRLVLLKPSSSIDLQRHQSRSEHWVVLDGFAKVTHGDKDLFLFVNESVFIPPNTWHQLTNTNSTTCLTVIEVQVGDCLGEQDVERDNHNGAR